MTLTWHGLAEERFVRYRSFINANDPGICGTYCVAVLAHDRVRMDTGQDLKLDQMISGIQPAVDQYRPYPGSFIWDIALGLNLLFLGCPVGVGVGLTTEYHVPRLIDRGLGPLIVGTTSLYGSTYHNHWVVVYAYAFDSDGVLWFKAYDNHGRHNAIIPARTTVGYAYLHQTTTE
ncbi:MAG: dihydrolipoamide dehydrogenase [Aerococcus sp.]|nr:dihydrolipoamide dehydrogenase [Aerococcus sp.]